MSKQRKQRILFAGLGLCVLAILLYQIPAINSRLAWRFEVAKTYAKNIIHPVGAVPTAIQNPTNTPDTIVSIPKVTATAPITNTPPPSTTTTHPIPAQASISSPPYEKQTPNNCGPAALSMMLHLYGWNGSQKEISDVIKPVVGDRNVNPEELAYWVRNYAGWLRIEYRVGGNLETIKRLIAARYPVIIESTTSLNPEDSGWLDDDLWAAHYLLITGYDDSTQTFTAQDTYRGPDKQVSYETLVDEWKPFNYLYMLIYLPEEESELKEILGSNWDANQNRQNSLLASQAATEQNSSDAFAWFNLGSNLTYFERYDEANSAFDKAREIGLPQRMFRYQFSPFIADFQANRNDDLMTLTQYAIQRTDMSEEAWLWNGWALYRNGETIKAIESWRKALKVNPNYQDALYALNFVGSTP